VKKISFLSLLLVFQAIFAMEKDASLKTSEQAISALLRDNPTLTREKIATFLQVKKIVSIAETIRENLKQKHGSYLQSSQPIRPKPHYGRTQEGLILFCHTYPVFLGTP